MSLPPALLTARSTNRARLGLLAAASALLFSGLSYGQNPGDPLFCQPQEGVTFLIVNGGAGVFTADPDCYNNNVNNDNQLAIVTTQGGSLAGTRTPGGINYIYTPPTPNFVGLDTFTIDVTTVWNGAGGTGSAGGNARPGGPATLTITLNVLPATSTLTASGGGSPNTVPVPAGSVTGCTAGGNAGQGPPPGAILGCVTRVIAATPPPSHGTLSVSGGRLIYTPNGFFSGTDTFGIQALGVNTDGVNALNSGTIIVTATVSSPAGTPALSTWGMLLLAGGLLAFGVKIAAGRDGGLRPSS